MILPILMALSTLPGAESTGLPSLASAAPAALSSPAPLHPAYLAAFDPTAGGETATLLGVLAWCATAAGVFGLIVVGIQMSIQLRRGEPGEGGEHFRGVFYVTLGCLLATTAGPLVSFLGNLSLQ